MADLSRLPAHILQDIFGSKQLEAEDLARLETTCYAFAAASGLAPNRLNSLPELAARSRCLTLEIFLRLPQAARQHLLRRCNGCWKLVLRFLHCLARSQECKIATGAYVSLMLDSRGHLFWCGSMPQLLECSRTVPIVLPAAVRVVQFSVSDNIVAMVTENGDIFTFGENAYRCCGHGVSGVLIKTPAQVTGLAGIECKQVEAGVHFTVAVTRAGEVYTWGYGQGGRLGHGDEQHRDNPEKIQGLPPVSRVSVGLVHTLVVTQHGAVFSFGSGWKSVLGHGTTESEYQPRQVQAFQDQNAFIVAAAAGDEQSAAIDSCGFVYTWGLGYCGALGHGDESDTALPRQVLALQPVRAVQVFTRKRKTFVLDDMGHVFAFGWTACGSLGVILPSADEVRHKVVAPTRISSLSDHHVAQVSTGYYHTVVATSKGNIFAFGDNEKMQLGTDGAPRSIVAMSSASEDSLFLDAVGA